MSLIDKMMNGGPSKPIDPNEAIYQKAMELSNDPRIQDAIERSAIVKSEIKKRAEKIKGYEKISLQIRSDLYKEIKLIAAKEDKFLYDIIEEAVRGYLMDRKS